MASSELGSACEGTSGDGVGALHQDVAEIVAACLPQNDLRELREASKSWCVIGQNAVQTLNPKGPLCEMLVKRCVDATVCMTGRVGSSCCLGLHDV